ncbi:MAG: type 1 glutamine amidotransferase [Labilithrix sp.]|nr:type 1 glutamine amidotransferase [Labilithrix sp.]
MTGKLEGKRVALLVTDGFEQAELTLPKAALEREGAVCDVVAPKEGTVKGWKHAAWGEEIAIDVPLSQASPDDYDALVLPGGVASPDALRVEPEVLRFVRRFFSAGKPVAAIGHGPWTLIDAGVVEGRRMTSWLSVRTDLVNAGAEWIDAEVVVDDGLITSRRAADLRAFGAKLVEEVAEGRAALRRPSRGAPPRPAEGR